MFRRHAPSLPTRSRIQAELFLRSVPVSYTAHKSESVDSVTVIHRKYSHSGGASVLASETSLDLFPATVSHPSPWQPSYRRQNASSILSMCNCTRCALPSVACSAGNPECAGPRGFVRGLQCVDEYRQSGNRCCYDQDMYIVSLPHDRAPALGCNCAQLRLQTRTRLRNSLGKHPFTRHEAL
jgi:hypothetical protein